MRPKYITCSDHSILFTFIITVIDTSVIQLPSKIKKRGRPKGGDSTVVGLPKKKKTFTKPVAFLKMHPKDQERGDHVLMLMYYTVLYM